MRFNDLLAQNGIAPEDVALCLHNPGNPAIRSALNVMAEEHPALFAAYQATHPKVQEATLKERSVMASFLPTAAGEFVFVGLDAIERWRDMRATDLDAMPGFPEMFEFLGVPPFAARGLGDDWRRAFFEFTPMSSHEDLRGRVVVSNPGGRNYMRRAERTDLPVVKLLRRASLLPPMPAWDEIALTASEFRRLAREWRNVLSNWRGIHLIVEADDGARYVGSASGVENLNGRWNGHVAGKSGVTTELSTRATENFRFSILALLSPTAPQEEAVAQERKWMRRLGTAEWGLNS